MLRFSRQALPGWLLEGGLGFEKIRDTAYQFVSKVVARYSGIVHRWIVSSSLNLFNHFGFSFEQVLEMTRAANMAVKAAGGRDAEDNRNQQSLGRVLCHDASYYSAVGVYGYGCSKRD